MFLEICLLAAAQIAGDPTAHLPNAPGAKTPAAHERPISRPQAEAHMVARFNALVAAMRDFSAVYNGTHIINARKAQAVRRAWKEFEAAESECRTRNQRESMKIEQAR
jgi:hypothetical protein